MNRTSPTSDDETRPLLSSSLNGDTTVLYSDACSSSTTGTASTSPTLTSRTLLPEGEREDLQIGPYFILIGVDSIPGNFQNHSQPPPPLAVSLALPPALSVIVILIQLIVANSDIILCTSKLHTDRLRSRHRPSRSARTLRICLLPHARHGRYVDPFSHFVMQRSSIFSQILHNNNDNKHSAGWCVALGGTTALDTLGSQAFTGGDRASVGIHLQRCLACLWILFIPVAFLWTFIEPVLLGLGQESQLSHDVQSFLRVLIIGAPAYIGFESVKKYLQCQGASLSVLSLPSFPHFLSDLLRSPVIMGTLCALQESCVPQHTSCFSSLR